MKMNYRVISHTSTQARKQRTASQAHRRQAAEQTDSTRQAPAAKQPSSRDTASTGQQPAEADTGQQKRQPASNDEPATHTQTSRQTHTQHARPNPRAARRHSKPHEHTPPAATAARQDSNKRARHKSHMGDASAHAW